MTPPGALIDEVLAGNCVAFAGAGFSVPAGVPDWERLLAGLAQGAEPAVRDHVTALLRTRSAEAFEQAAQALQDGVARDDLLDRLERLLAPSEPPTDGMRARLRWLGGIPFRAVLTTNFDPLIRGEMPGNAAYWKVLRATHHQWFDERYWDDTPRGPLVVKLHGDVREGRDHVVLSRRDYRRRLYTDAAYVAFVRSVLTHHTVLYLGFSFSDAYLNELRSEVLALLAGEEVQAPIAWAVIPDVAPATVDHFRRHEGIEILTYPSAGGRGHEPFDDFLRNLHDRTNPRHRLGTLLAGKRILWVDPHPDNNEPAFRFLESVTREAGTGYEMARAANLEEALEHLGEGGGRECPFHLVLTHWGRDTGTAERLLREIRRRDVRVPVVVFAWDQDADRRKAVALSLGAVAYCGQWTTLFRTLEQVLLPGRRTL